MIIAAPIITAITSFVVKYAIVSVGIGILSYAAISVLALELIGYAETAYNDMNPDMLNFANYIGIGEAFGIIFGSVMARLAYSQFKRFGFVPE